MPERNNEYVYQPPAKFTEELRQRINNAGFSDEFKQQIKSAQKEEGRKMFEDLTKAIEIIEQQYKVGIDYSKGADMTALCMVVGKQAEAVIKALSEYLELTKAKTEGRLVVLPETGIGDLSDGYHTFNELYHHRAILFSVICNEHPDISWKSKLHHDGTMFDGMFIVGINTPEGQATYHYDINPYWDMFRVRELEKAPEWDGHTSEQAIERIAGLSREAAEKALGVGE